MILNPCANLLPHRLRDMKLEEAPFGADLKGKRLVSLSLGTTTAARMNAQPFAYDQGTTEEPELRDHYVDT